jgi:hypothetical protein
VSSSERPPEMALSSATEPFLRLSDFPFFYLTNNAR